jgi:neutral ceramidase
MHRFGWLVPAALFLLGFTAHAQLPAKVFRAGAATSNVTPPLGTSINGGMVDRRATHVHDELHARCLVLDDGTTRLAFAIVDSCMVPIDVIDGAKKIVAERTGIPATHVLVSATHTHSAPTAGPAFQSDSDPAYLAFLATRVADGIQRAANNLEPARIGWGVAEEPDHVFNRRWKLKPGAMPANPFGQTTDGVKMNPGQGNPDLVEPAGPVDPQVWVVSVRSLEGRHIALLGNYSLHYVGGESPGAISADYYGMFAERVERLLEADRQDPPFVGMMSNGTSGNINNVNYALPAPPARQEPYEQMRLVADAVATKAAEAVASMIYHDWVPLSAKTATLTLGVRKPSADELTRARDLLAANPHPVQTQLEGIYAVETVDLAAYPDAVPITLQALHLGDLSIAAIPCETFVEIGLELKAFRKDHAHFTVSLANGYNGYLPTPKHHKLGGYETWRAKSSYLEVNASPKIVAELKALLTTP